MGLEANVFVVSSISTYPDKYKNKGCQIPFQGKIDSQNGIHDHRSIVFSLSLKNNCREWNVVFFGFKE